MLIALLLIGEIERFDPNSTIPDRVVRPLVSFGHSVDVLVTAQPFALRDMFAFDTVRWARLPRCRRSRRRVAAPRRRARAAEAWDAAAVGAAARARSRRSRPRASRAARGATRSRGAPTPTTEPAVADNAAPTKQRPRRRRKKIQRDVASAAGHLRIREAALDHLEAAEDPENPYDYALLVRRAVARRRRGRRGLPKDAVATKRCLDWSGVNDKIAALPRYLAAPWLRARAQLANSSLAFSSVETLLMATARARGVEVAPQPVDAFPFLDYYWWRSCYPANASTPMSRRASSGGPPDGGDECKHLMAKKIAQLTKVVYHVNTVNEDHQALKKAHREEVNAVVRDGSRKLKALTEAVARKKEDEQLRAELERCKETQAKEKEQALAGMRKTVAAREASLHSEYGEKVGALQAEVKHVEAKFLEASRHFAQAAQRLQDGAARTSGEREAEAREREEALDRLRKQHREELERLVKDRELDRERAKRSAEELLAAAKQKHDDDVQKLQDVNDALRAEGDRKAEEAARDATAKAEAARDVALGQLRAELEGTREEALAKQAAAHGGELREKQRAIEQATDVATRADRGRRPQAVPRRRGGPLRGFGGPAAGPRRRGRGAAGDVERLRAELRAAGDDDSTRLAAARDRADKLEADLARADDERRTLLKSLEELRGKYDRMTKMTEKELEKKDAALSAKDSELEKARGAAQAAKDEVKQLKQELKGAAKAAGDVDAALKKSEALVAKREGELDALKREMDRLKAGSANAASSAAAAQREALDRLREEIAALERGRADDATRREEEKQRHAAEAALKKKDKDYEAAKAELEKQLSKALKNSSADADAWKAQAEETAAALVSEQAAHAKTKKGLDRQLQIVDSLKAQIEELRQQLASEADAARRQEERKLRELEDKWKEKLAAQLAKASGEARAPRTGGPGEARRRPRGRALEKSATPAARLADAESAAATAATAAVAERGRLEARVAELTDDLEGLRGDSVRVAAELRAPSRARRELGEAKQALRKTSDDLDGARAAARTAAKDALDKLDAATTRLEAALEDARAKGATVDARDEEIARLKADHAKRVADDDEAHAAATASLTKTLTAKHDALEAKTTGERLDLEERLRSEIARGAADLDAARREAEEAEQNLVAAMEDREQAAARHHASEMDRAAEDAAAELGEARREAENRHANLLEAFEADRLRQETALRDLQGQYALLERKYAARESRPEDLEKIADLESENNQRAEDLARMKKEMAYFKNELLNREENFNKKFGASPNVGVMNVLPQKKKKAIPRGF
ncbi:hypothetical protein JL720_6644 [Aureococcus anophagefferens]|nr:hypothetical protein JL720_6644 [Aureococcus anophagefferens]